MEGPSLTEFERTLLELCSMAGETTRLLDEKMLEASPGRAAVESALRGLVARGLMTTRRGFDLSGGWRAYRDNWWDVTDSGRAAIGLPPRSTTWREL
jgi:hypothetical protein